MNFKVPKEEVNFLLICTWKSFHISPMLLFQAEAEREEKYFTELEKKEMMEEKMLAVTKLEVTVVTCRQVSHFSLPFVTMITVYHAGI